MSPTIPPFQSTRAFRLGWSVSLGIGLLLVVLATAPAFLPESWASGARLFFASVCHQIPERSPHLGGSVLAVCHRCYGIYWGIPLAILAGGFFRERFRQTGGLPIGLLVVSLIPLGLDWTLDVLGLVSNTPLSRILTGGLFGMAAGTFLLSATVDVFDRHKEQARPAAEAEV